MSTRITEAMVEAMTEVAIDGPGYVSFYPSLHDCRRLLEVALSTEPGEAEPVAYQQRDLRPSGWTDWYPSGKKAFEELIASPDPNFEVRALYAAPIPEDTREDKP